MSVLDVAVIVAALLAAAWWGVARRRRPGALDALSLGTLGLAAAALAVEGPRWQLVPWQLLALAGAAAAGLRRWRPGRPRRRGRVLGRLALVAGVALGGVGLLFARVPALPQPAGPHPVGSQVFRWTDERRPEPFAADPRDRRQVVAQAWYPAAATPGPPAPYFEAPGPPPGAVEALPAWFFRAVGAFGEVDTHAATSAPVSADRPAWPILLFSPGWGEPREAYTTLCTDLASRGYVVVALSHPYESPVALLADGRVVGQAAEASILRADMARLSDIRAADGRFVLDQLGRLADLAPGSPLAGRLDVGRVGIVGHSLGGATAAQVVATDDRFLVGVNIDGTLTDALAGAVLDRPFLWLQSDGAQLARYVQVRDRLLGGLRGGGELLVVGGSSHGSFTDSDSSLSPAGRLLLGDGVGSESAGPIPALAGDVIAGFVGPLLGRPGDRDLDHALARHPSIRRERRIAAAG